MTSSTPKSGRSSGQSPAPPAGPDPPRSPFGQLLADLGISLRSARFGRILSIVGLSIAGLGVLALGSVALVIRHYSRDLPDVATLSDGYRPAEVTRILARDGSLLDELFHERRTVVPFERVPDHLKSAILAAEDAGFYEHAGLDYLGLVRAVVVNLRSGHVRQGGSTITQQVVKNVLLDHSRSYERKIKETILAYRIERHLSKEQILGMYMNHIYLGHGRYGVEEASRFYFGKHVEEINVGEAALLAGVVAAPERYSPRKSEEKALVRRRYVLDQMLAKGFMTKEAHAAYVDAPLRLSPDVERESDIAPEVVPRVQALLAEVAKEDAKRGGFTVTTTIDPALQVAARKAVRDGLDAYLARHGVRPPFTAPKQPLWGKLHEGAVRRHGIYVGKVVALDDVAGTLDVAVGNVIGRVLVSREERYNPKHLAPSHFARIGALLRVRVIDDPVLATPSEPVRLQLELGPEAALVALSVSRREVLALVGSYEAVLGGLDRTVQAKRQPGSTFKPIYYSRALSEGDVTAATAFEFPLTEAQKRRKAANPAAPAVDGVEVPETEVLLLREGLAKSDNRVALEVFRKVGAEQAATFAQLFGFESRLGADESLALGSYEVTPWEMTAAYAVFPGGGTFLEPSLFSSVTRASGPVALPPVRPRVRALEPAVSYLMTSLLESVVREGTGKAAKTLGRPVGGKTGTTNRAKDAWFVGFSADIVAGVWVGYDDAAPLGASESGGRTALPIWIDFMKAAHRDRPAVAFPRPANIVEREIDPATGLLAAYGQQSARTEIFVSGTEPSDQADRAGDSATPEGGVGAGGASQAAGEEPSNTTEEAPPF